MNKFSNITEYTVTQLNNSIQNIIEDSFKIIYPTIAAMNGIAANINNVTAAVVIVIEKINAVKADAKQIPPIIDEIPILLKFS